MSVRLRSLLPLVAVACASEAQLLTPDGLPLESAPPAPYRIAVLPVADAQKLAPQGDGLHFTIAPAALREQLVAQLTALRTASATFVCADEQEAAAGGADLILAARIVDARVEHVSNSDYWWASGILWLTTWIGGLFVPDSTYDARLAIECDLRNVSRNTNEPGEVIGFTAASSTADLSFWDRNALLDLGVFESLILPPFWTSDDVELTSGHLSSLAVREIAGEIATFLKFGLPEREKDKYGQVLFDEPVNGATVGATTHVAGTVSSRHGVEEIVVEADGVGVPLAAPVRGPVQQMVPFSRSFSEPFRTGEFALREGANTIVVRVTLFDDKAVRRWTSTRTLVVHCGNEAGTAARGGGQ